MKIYIICSVRNASPELQARLEAYADWLEDKGHEVHLPHRDTNQEASGYEICMQNGAGIALAEEIHVVYDPNSTGSHFDLGVAFACDQLFQTRKRIRVVNFGHAQQLPEGKSFARMMEEWMHVQNEYYNLYPCKNEGTELDFTIPFEDF